MTFGTRTRSRDHALSGAVPGSGPAARVVAGAGRQAGPFLFGIGEPQVAVTAGCSPRLRYRRIGRRRSFTAPTCDPAPRHANGCPLRVETLSLVSPALFLDPDANPPLPVHRVVERAVRR